VGLVKIVSNTEISFESAKMNASVFYTVTCSIGGYVRNICMGLVTHSKLLRNPPV
jgi:tRNA U55 pseudouridine synthase TruB